MAPCGWPEAKWSRLSCKWSVFIQVGRALTGWALAVWVNAFPKAARCCLTIWSHTFPGFCWATACSGGQKGSLRNTITLIHSHLWQIATSLGWNLTDDPSAYLCDFCKRFSWVPARGRDANWCTSLVCIFIDWVMLFLGERAGLRV